MTNLDLNQKAGMSIRETARQIAADKHWNAEQVSAVALEFIARGWSVLPTKALGYELGRVADQVHQAYHQALPGELRPSEIGWRECERQACERLKALGAQ